MLQNRLNQLDQLGFPKMFEQAREPFAQFQKLLASSPWIFEAIESAFREREKLLADIRAQQRVSKDLADALRPYPFASSVEGPAAPLRRIGFAPWDD
jgi:hypothetical protein